MAETILKEGQMFKTVITSERHRNLGYCEKSDFGSLELVRLSPAQKKLVVSFKGYSDEPLVEYIEHKGIIYSKLSKKTNMAGMSRDEEKNWTSKQGKYSDKSAIALMLELRKRYEKTFSSVHSDKYIIIGNTLYAEYCKTKNLKITVAGNLLFSCWLSINFESHGGKATYSLSKKNFERVFKAQKKRFEDAKPKEGAKRGDGHVHFSYPTQITWGTDYLK